MTTPQPETPRSIDVPTPTPYRTGSVLWMTSGWARPLPAHPSTKKIQYRGFSGDAGRPPTVDEVRGWLTSDSTSNLAIVMPDNVIGLDVDHGYVKVDAKGVSRMKQGGLWFRALQEELGELPATIRSSARDGNTDSGIRFYRLPETVDGMPVNSDDFPGALSSTEPTTGKEVLLDIEVIRRKHRYAIVAPSVHAETGRRYRLWDEETGESLDVPPNPATLPLLPDAWVRHLISQGRVASRELPPPRPRPPAGSTDEKPSDWLERAVSWQDVMGWAGWSFEGMERDGSLRYARPGKDPRLGHSGMVVDEPGKRLRIWSTDGSLSVYWQLGLSSASGGSDVVMCSKLDVLAAGRFGGDRSAASKWIAEQMRAERPQTATTPFVEPTIAVPTAPVAAAFAQAPILTPPSVDAARMVMSPSQAAADWEPPESLDQRTVAEADLPVWPIDILPDWMRRRIEEVSLGNISVDLVAHYAFGAAVAAVTGRLRADNGTFEVPCNLYLVASAGPGLVKSGTVTTMAGHLRKVVVPDLRRQWAKETEADRLNAETARARAESARKALKKAAEVGLSGAAADQVVSVADAARFIAEADELEEALKAKPDPRLFADDASPEALTQVIARTGGRQAILSDEPIVIKTITGAAYGGKSVNTSIYLIGHDGGRYTRTRADKAEGPGDDLDFDANLSIVAATQPKVLETLLGRDDLMGEGLIQRFQMCHGIELAGHRDVTRRSKHAYREDYEERLGAFAREWIRRGPNEVVTVRFSAQALWANEEYRKRIEHEIRPGGRLNFDPAYATKVQDGVLWRVAAILHVLHGRGAAEPVDAETMFSAIRLCDYWIDHVRFLRSAKGAGRDPVNEVADGLLEWLNSQVAKRTEWVTFGATATIVTETALNRGRFRGRKDAQWMQAALVCLQDRGWIRIVHDHPDDPRGNNRGSGLVIALHPSIGSMGMLRADGRPSFHQVFGSEDWSEDRLAGAPVTELGQWIIALRNRMPEWATAPLDMGAFPAPPEPTVIEAAAIEVEPEVDNFKGLFG